jgi:hypothetical protein
LLTAEQRKGELEQLALNIRQDCENVVRNLDDSGQTHRIIDLLTSARVVLPNNQHFVRINVDKYQDAWQNRHS